MIGKAERIRYALPTYVYNQLLWISEQRNRVAHQENAYLEDVEEFEASAKLVIETIERIPINHDRNLIGWLRRAFRQGGRRRRRKQTSPAAVLVVFAVLAVLYCGSRISDSVSSSRADRAAEQNLYGSERLRAAAPSPPAPTPSAPARSKPKPAARKPSAPLSSAGRTDADGIAATDVAVTEQPALAVSTKRPTHVTMTPAELDAF